MIEKLKSSSRMVKIKSSIYFFIRNLLISINWASLVQNHIPPPFSEDRGLYEQTSMPQKYNVHSNQCGSTGKILHITLPEEDYTWSDMMSYLCQDNTLIPENEDRGSSRIHNEYQKICHIEPAKTSLENLFHSQPQDIVDRITGKILEKEDTLKQSSGHDLFQPTSAVIPFPSPKSFTPGKDPKICLKFKAHEDGTDATAMKGQDACPSCTRSLIFASVQDTARNESVSRKKNSPKKGKKTLNQAQGKDLDGFETQQTSGCTDILASSGDTFDEREPDHARNGFQEKVNQTPYIRSRYRNNLFSLTNKKTIFVLQHKGILEMGKGIYLTSQFVELLADIKKTVLGSIPKSHPQISEWSGKFEWAMKRTIPYLIRPFFGCLGVIYCMAGHSFSKSSLIKEGAKFLHAYLIQWASIQPSEMIHLSQFIPQRSDAYYWNPDQLLGYLMNLSSSTCCPPSTIWGFINRFLISFSSKVGSAYLTFNSTDFYNACKSMFEQNRAGWWLRTSGIDSIFSNQESLISTKKIGLYPPDKDMEDIRARPPHKLKKDSYIRTGELVMRRSRGLPEQVSEYFANMKSSFVRDFDVLTADLTAKSTRNGRKRKAEGESSQVQSTAIRAHTDILFRNAICAARFKITPVFFAMLEVYHARHPPFPNVESTLQDGWEFLKRYFSTWNISSCLRQTETKPKFQPQSVGRPSGNAIDWSDTKEVVRCFTKKKPSATSFKTFAIYLLQQWDDDLFCQRHRDLYHSGPRSDY